MGHLGRWQFLYTNPQWRQSVLRYTRFAERYRQYLTGARPQSSLLVAFQPKDIEHISPELDKLIEQGVDFNVVVYGPGTGRALLPDTIRKYAAVIAPNPDAVCSKGVACFSSINSFLRSGRGKTEDLVTVEGRSDIRVRLMRKGNTWILHLKRIGYSETNDDYPSTQGFRVMLRVPGIHRALYATPESPNARELQLTSSVATNSFEISGMNAFGLVVLL